MLGRGGGARACRLDPRRAPWTASVWAAIALVFAMLAAGAGFAPPARAHAVLLETVPADGAVLAASPDEILLRFNEPVRPIAVRVIDEAGQAVAAPEAIEATDGVLRLSLPTPLPDGRYVVSYRVTSADAHPVSGAFLFTVGQASAHPGPIAGPASTTETGWRVATALNRTLHDAALLAAAGGAMFLLFVAGGLPPSARGRIEQGLFIAGVIGIGTAILGLGLQGGLLAGAPAGAILAPAPWRIGALSSAGPSALAATVGLTLLMLGLRMRRNTLRSCIMLAGVLGSVGSLLLTGHAAATAPRWLTAPAWGVHLLAVAFWIGSLFPLLVALHDRPAAAAGTVRRFSRLAVLAVAALVAAGLVIATVQVGHIAALIGTAYGRLLLLKLCLVAGLLLIAAHNKWRLTPALAAGDEAAPRRLRRAIGIEIGVVLLILAVTAVLGQTPPPHDSGHAAGHVMHGAMHGTMHETGPATHGQPAGYTALAGTGERRARIEVTPATAGQNTVTITLTNAEGAPVTPLELTVAFSQPAAGIAPIERKPVAIGPGRYRLTSFPFLLPGRWTVRVEALITDFDKAVLTTEISIR